MSHLSILILFRCLRRLFGKLQHLKVVGSWLNSSIALVNRVLGGLLSAHLILTDPDRLLGDFSMSSYNDELLTLAHDLATRLLPAFEGSATGIPFPRVRCCKSLSAGVLL